MVRETIAAHPRFALNQIPNLQEQPPVAIAAGPSTQLRIPSLSGERPLPQPEIRCRTLQVAQIGGYHTPGDGAFSEMATS